MFKINNSLRQAFKSCPRKLYWSTVAGLETVNTGRALIIGRAFHKGVEHWRVTKATVPDASVSEAIHVLVEEFTFGGLGGEALMVEAAKLKAYLLGYFKAYQGDVPLLPRWRAEVKIETATDHGTLDAMFEDDDGFVWMVDDKTRSVLSPVEPETLPLNEQVLNYGLLVRARGWDFGGVIWRETRKSASRPRRGEHMDAFTARVVEEYTGPTALERYRETRVEILDAQLDAYEKWKDKIDVKIRVALEAESVDDLPWNGSSCLGAYGACEFLSLCTKSQYMAAQYKPSTRGEPINDYWHKTLWPQGYEKWATDNGSRPGVASGDDVDF